MQTITREFNLSETIFVLKAADPRNTAKVRIFFPGGEMPFAGHPTVGCAVFLAEGMHKPGCSFETEIRLEEQAGLVPVKVSRIGDVPRAQFTAPVIPFVPDVAHPSAEEAARAAGLAPADIGFGGHVPRLLQGGPRFMFVPLKSRDALSRARPIEPHWSALVDRLGTDGGYFYTPGGDGPRAAFRARMFAPTGGIPEDPATGSATAILARQLADFDRLGNGTHGWGLEQGYEMGRPSDLLLEIDLAGGKLASVRVAGQAVQIMQGMLEV
jgi:trans-2,3-dihydro-3-hydroxyanthranilate isomerase